ncbi:hypothetical protein ULMS_12660 [Patiriisocius marinistellae]|uniref:Peptidase S8/S53 domain-containing protein n=1 Tax=Patiriisocius marinistellae TaxID=2494560 RepID=A0A5J4FWS9_9FLAO|nr:S8/S53 family peptidase [Patiriisocius marinistellae]GEQ85758.1 hypothetical protein ULMS_12660 [Patiriisocius marinistellae]
MPKNYSHKYFDEDKGAYINVEFNTHNNAYIVSVSDSILKNDVISNKQIRRYIENNFIIKNKLSNKAYLALKKNSREFPDYKFESKRIGKVYWLNNIPYQSYNCTLLVHYDSKISEAKLKKITDDYQGKILMKWGNVTVLKFKNNHDLERAQKTFALIKGVTSELNLAKLSYPFRYLLENYIGKVNNVPLILEGNKLFDAIQRIHSEELIGDPSIKIGIIDDGVYNHPYLKKALDSSSGYDYVEDKIEPKFNFNDWHGTMCAGIIGAQKSNDLGINGIAAGCKIVPLKIIQDNISCIFFLYRALYDAAFTKELKVDVISCSLETKFSQSEIIRKLINKITTNTASHKGIPLVFSAGNKIAGEISELDFIRKIKNVIVVGAVDQKNKPLKNSKEGENILLSAVGYKVVSLDLPGTDCVICDPPLDHDDFLYFSNTSSAAPQVAAVIALIKGKNKNITVNELKIYLTKHLKPRFKGQNAKRYGAGVLNIENIINQLNK